MPPPASGVRPFPRAPVSIVVARLDDLLARGLHELLGGDASLAIVARDVEQPRIPVVLRAHRADVAILDARALAKLSEVRELAAAHPATRLVLFVDELSNAECAQLLAFGASACLARDTQARDVLNAVHLASRGLKLVPRFASSPGRATLGGQPLTRREAEVLPLLAQGRTNPQIALALNVGVETVRTHARNIYRKLGVSSRNELTAAPVDELARSPASATGPPRRRAAGRRPRARRGHDARHP